MGLPLLGQVLQEVADSWELLHYELHRAVAPATTAWRAGQLSTEQMAEVGPEKAVGAAVTPTLLEGARERSSGGCLLFRS